MNSTKPTSPAPELRPIDPKSSPRNWLPEKTPSWFDDSGMFPTWRSAHSVYRLYDCNKDLLYVGMSYSHPGGRWTAHRRTSKWWPLVAYGSIEWVLGTSAAAIEKAAIQAEHPRYNIQHARSRSSFMVFTREGPDAVIEQFRAHLLPEDFAALVAAFTAQASPQANS